MIIDEGGEEEKEIHWIKSEDMQIILVIKRGSKLSDIKDIAKAIASEVCGESKVEGAKLEGLII